MSVIACRIKKNHIEFAADSIMVSGRSQVKDGVKLIKRGNIIIGSAGLVSEFTAMRYFLRSHYPSDSTEQALLDFLWEFGKWKDATMKSGIDLQNSYLISINCKVFSSSGYAVLPVETFDAIGAGRDFALAAMFNGKTAIEAVNTACELSIYCEKPIISYKVKR